MLFSRDSCAVAHLSPHIRAYISRARSWVESAARSARPLTCAIAQLASLFTNTHPSFTCSDRSMQRIHSTLHCDAVAVLIIPSNLSLSHVSVSSSAPTTWPPATLSLHHNTQAVPLTDPLNDPDV